MSFLIRTLFVVGLIYLLSPLRAELPDWIVNPSPEAARDVTPVLAQTATTAVTNACKGHEGTCADLAKSAAGKAAALVASNDAQSAFETLVRQVAAEPPLAAAPAAEKPQAAKAKPVVASAAPAEPAPAAAPSAAKPRAAEPNGLDLPIIPLPPRRKI